MFFSVFMYRGALTSKPYSFVARPWEFKTIESVDFFDSTVSSIRFDLRGDKILRVLPRINENINEEWISDRIRFSVDGFRAQRIDIPLINVKKTMRALPWSKFMLALFGVCTTSLFNRAVLKNLSYVSNAYSNILGAFHKMPFYIRNVGPFSDFESLIWLNFFQNTFFFKHMFFGSRFFLPNPNSRSSFYIPVLFKDFLKIKNLILISINPRLESPVLNIRLRQTVIKFGNTVSVFGQNFISNFPLLLNSGLLSLVSFIRGNHWLCSSIFLKNSLILSSAKTNEFLKFINNLKFDSSSLKLGVFNRYSSDINSLEAGVFNQHPPSFYSSNCRPIGVDLSFGTLNPLCINRVGAIGERSSVIKISAVSHGSSGLVESDFVLPVSAPFERNSIFLNLEGRPQLSRIAISSPNGVLDFKDSVIVSFTLFFNKDNGLGFLKNKIVAFVSYSLLSMSENATKSIWPFVHKLLGSFAISKSLFLKEFLCPILEYIKTGNFKNLDTNNYYNKNNVFNSKNSHFNLIGNRNAGELFETVENFYIQDEISSASPSMLASSERLRLHQTYVL